jgi:serine/threonine protein kinase
VTTPERRRRFAAEIAAAADRSAAGHTVRLYTSGLLPDCHPYLVTESLPTLAAHLDEHGLLEPAVAVSLGERIGRILAAAHRAGTVHRHVTPQAVLMRADGTPVLDVFGVHTMVTSEDPGEVVYGAMRWLFAYASPEAIGGVRTAAGDVYSLAATMYGALCGQPPYWPADADAYPLDVYRRMGQEPVAQPPGVPVELFGVLRRAMSFEPADRQASMDEFADDLARLST